MGHAIYSEKTWMFCMRLQCEGFRLFAMAFAAQSCHVLISSAIACAAAWLSVNSNLAAWDQRVMCNAQCEQVHLHTTHYHFCLHARMYVCVHMHVCRLTKFVQCFMSSQISRWSTSVYSSAQNNLLTIVQHHLAEQQLIIVSEFLQQSTWLPSCAARP